MREKIAKNDAEMVREFVRVEYIGSVRKISVCQISWDGPHTPVSTWKVVYESKTASRKVAAEAISQILNDRRYFEICTECGDRNPCGWMDDRYCQSCAERNHGTVY
jgi:hypothetical protein